MTHVYPYPGAEQDETYEWENRIADPERRIEAFMASVQPLAGIVFIDIGSGSGFHAAHFAETARQVFAVEPAPKMLQQAHRRFADEPHDNLSVIAAGAEEIPLRDGIADVIHSRFAYFFGPETRHTSSCVPGIREAQRLLKPGGVFFVIDNNFTSGQFAEFLCRYAYGAIFDAAARDVFWSEQGFEQVTIASNWIAPDREVLQRVIAMEFPAEHVAAIMDSIDGASLTYHYDVFYYRA